MYEDVCTGKVGSELERQKISVWDFFVGGTCLSWIAEGKSLEAGYFLSGARENDEKKEFAGVQFSPRNAQV